MGPARRSAPGPRCHRRAGWALWGHAPAGPRGDAGARAIATGRLMKATAALSTPLAVLATTLAIVLACGLTRAPRVHATGGAGLDLIHNEVERLSSPDVPASVDSTVRRRRIFGFWHHEWSEDDRLNVDLEREAYALRAADGTGLIDLTLHKVHPRYRRRSERWALELAVLGLDLGRNDALYATIPQDDTDTFYLPALVADVTPRPLLFRAGFWEEYEVLPLDRNTYTIALSRLFLVGAGFAFTPDTEARLEVHESRRFYPERSSLERTDVVGTLRVEDPLDAGEAPLWREAWVELARQHYPTTGDSFAKLTLASALRFSGETITQFLVPRLTWRDSYVVYGPGREPETLLETIVEEPDALLRVKYEAFTHLGESPYLLAWGATVESSLIQGVERTLIAHVKLERTY